MSRAAAIIVNYNSGDDLTTCVMSLLQSSVLSEIIVVDNASTDGSTDIAGGLSPIVTVVKRQNDGFGGGANAGASFTNADVLFFLNPDVIASPECVIALVEDVERNGGISGPALRVAAMDNALEFGASLDYFSMVRGHNEHRPPLYVPGCALAIDHTTFDRVGGFDTRYFLFSEDLELCWRVLCSGGDVRVVDVEALHEGGGSIPGGYPLQGWSTSELRISLRERNTLAAYVSCAPAPMAVALSTLAVIKLFLSAVVLACIGRRQLATAL